ncbi:unnamed protein product, partial [Ascophyllum nodosum]
MVGAFFVTDHCKVDGKQRHDRSDGVSFITPWRADELRSRRRSRGQDKVGRQYIGASASSRASQDEDQDPCSGGL